MRFDRIAMLDWSAARGPKRGADSIWLGLAGAGGRVPQNLATRAAAAAALFDLARAPGRLLIGVDIGFAWPAGFAAGLTGQARALAVWDWLAARVIEEGGVSNYRTVAAAANRRFPGGGPFWGDGTRAGTPGLSRTRPELPAGMDWHRGIERAARFDRVAPKSMFQLAGIGAVGAQALTCIPLLHRLRAALPAAVAIWPFEPVATARIVLTEVYFSLLGPLPRQAVAAGGYPCLDAAQVDLLAQAVARLDAAGGLAALMTPQADTATIAEEGWILGAGQHRRLQSALG